MKNLIKGVIRKLCFKNLHNSYFVQNINKDFTCHQKRVLIIYKVTEFTTDFDNTMVYHPNMFHSLQMVRELVNRNCCVDIFDCNDLASLNIIKRKSYDVVIGFGKLYKSVIKTCSIPQKVLFITENDPEVVLRKYKMRLDGFKSRHPKVSVSQDIPRNGFYDIEQFFHSDSSIIMNSHFNAETMIKHFNRNFFINVNGFKNTEFNCNYENNINERKRSFVWLGSNGAIHKGLDLLIDTFSQLPQLTLNIYGLTDKEYQMLKPLFTSNIINRGKINIQSPEFITEVVHKNLFIVSASCSEGMQSGIATGMLHGLIPIVTPETGYDTQPFVHELQNISIDSLATVFKQLSDTDDSTLLQESNAVYEYAAQQFTLEVFSNQFSTILNEIL